MEKLLDDFKSLSIDSEEIDFSEFVDFDLNEDLFMNKSLKTINTYQLDNKTVQIIGERHRKDSELNYDLLSEQLKSLLIDPDNIFFEKNLKHNIIGTMILKIFKKVKIYDIRKELLLSGVTRKIRKTEKLIPNKYFLKIIDNPNLNLTFDYFNEEYNSKLLKSRNFCHFFKDNELSEKHKNYLYNFFLSIYDISTFNHILQKDNVLLYCGYKHSNNIESLIERYNNSRFKIRKYKVLTALYRDEKYFVNLFNFDSLKKYTKIYFERILLYDELLFDIIIKFRNVIYFDNFTDFIIDDTTSIVICTNVDKLHLHEQNLSDFLS